MLHKTTGGCRSNATALLVLAAGDRLKPKAVTNQQRTSDKVAAWVQQQQHRHQGSCTVVLWRGLQFASFLERRCTQTPASHCPHNAKKHASNVCCNYAYRTQTTITPRKTTTIRTTTPTRTTAAATTTTTTATH